MPDKPLAFKDPTTLTRWTKGVLYAEIALSVVAIASDVMEQALLVAMESGAYAGAQPEMMAQADASDQRQQIIGILQLIMAAVSGVLILCWIYRANANARALGAAQMRFTPGWAVSSRSPTFGSLTGHEGDLEGERQSWKLAGRAPGPPCYLGGGSSGS